MTKSKKKILKKDHQISASENDGNIVLDDAHKNLRGNSVLTPAILDAGFKEYNSQEAKTKKNKEPVKEEKPKGSASLHDNASKYDLADTFRALVSHPNFSPEVLRLELLALVESLSDIYHPSEYWTKRDKSLKESPIDFIKRVYAPVLNGFFTTSDLKASDGTLYTAFYTWRRDHNNNQSPSLKVLNLPTKDQLSDWLIENPDELSKAIEKPKTFHGKAASRIDDAKYARAKKKKQYPVGKSQQPTSP